MNCKNKVIPKTGGGLSDNKKARSPKSKDDLSALFSDKETEEAFQEWRRASVDLISLSKFEKMPDVLQWLLYAKAEFWLDRYSKGWDDALDLVKLQSELLNKMQNAVPQAYKHGEVMALFKERDKLRAHESRILGGSLRAEQLAIQKRNKHDAIAEKEKELAPKFVPHKLNKEIARALGLETDYVRKARSELKRKNAADI